MADVEIWGGVKVFFPQLDFTVVSYITDDIISMDKSLKIFSLQLRGHKSVFDGQVHGDLCL